MATTVTVPLVNLPTENFPVLNVANGIVPDEALAISVTLSFTPTVTALLVDVSESARKFNTIPIQGVYIDMSAAAVNLALQIPASGQMILAKAGTQGYYALISPMPVRVIAQLSAAPASNLNLQIILYNTPIESQVWGYAQGATGPQGPPGPAGPTGPQGPPGSTTLVPATPTVLGGVKIGANVNVLADGTISVAAPYILPPATTTVLGGVKSGTNVTVAGDGTISVLPTNAFQTPWLSSINGSNFILFNVQRLGILNSNPVCPLDVAGVMRSTSFGPGPTSGAGLELGYQTGAIIQSYDRTAAAYDSMSIEASPIIINSASGANVAIGNIVPLVALDVFGTLRSQSSGTPTGGAGMEMGYITSISVGTLQCINRGNGLFQQLNIDGSTVILNSASHGFVGIGLVPVHQLQLSVDDAAKPGTNTWTIVSDIRTKRKISRFEGDIEVIRKLDPIVSEYNGRGNTPEGMRVVSFDPEKLRKIVPQCVSSARGKLDPDDDEETDLLGVNTHEIFFHLLRAVQMIDRRLTDLERKRK